MFKRLFGGKSGGGSVPEPGSAPKGDFSVALADISGPELDFLLIRPSDEDIARALDGWRWIGLAGLTAMAVSAFGEVFFQREDGAILHLDTLDGALAPVADSLSQWVANLNGPEHRDRLLLAGLVIAARSRGIVLAAGECYDFKLPPALGGATDVEQMHKQLFVVKSSIAGQLHEQIKDLPPGTPIDKIEISG